MICEMICEGKQNAVGREFGRMAFAHAAVDSGYAAVFDEAMTIGFMKKKTKGNTGRTG